MALPAFSQALPLHQSKPGDEAATAHLLAHRTIRVGPTRLIKTVSAASLQAKVGDLIEVDSGDYVGDVAVWDKDKVTLRAVGGRVRLIANGSAAEAKAIWVVRAKEFSVDGFDFQGARVADRNGAGIRFESGSLSVRNSSFTHNESGLLTGNRRDAELTIENCEFGHNGSGDGQSHNLYVGTIARLTVTGSYFHHGRSGHLLKSRASMSSVRNNRLTDELGGRASYELEFPSGGVAYVVGNVIQQGPFTTNRILISYGAEGYRWLKNELYIVNNTLIDDSLARGQFLRVTTGANVVMAVNNLLIGHDLLESAGPGDYRNNFSVAKTELAAGDDGDYRLRSGSSLLGKAVDPGSANGQSLKLIAEYRNPRGTVYLSGPVRSPGALQSGP